MSAFCQHNIGFVKYGVEHVNWNRTPASQGGKRFYCRSGACGSYAMNFVHDTLRPRAALEAMTRLMTASTSRPFSFKSASVKT